jgi:hypothetical protein
VPPLALPVPAVAASPPSPPSLPLPLITVPVEAALKSSTDYGLRTSMDDRFPRPPRPIAPNPASQR